MPDRKPRRPEPDEEYDEEDEAPAKKKKKKKKKPQAPSPWPKIIGFGAMGLVGVLFAVFIIWTVISLAGGGPPAQPVKSFAKFNTDGHEWGFEYPAGWASASYGLPGKRECEIKGNDAVITIKENLAGSLVGDIARAAAGGQEVPEELTPVARVHDMRKPKDSKTYIEGEA